MIAKGENDVNNHLKYSDIPFDKDTDDNLSDKEKMMKVFTMDSLPSGIRSSVARINGENITLNRDMVKAFRPHQVAILPNIQFGMRQNQNWSPSNSDVIYSTEFAPKDEYAALPPTYNCEFIKSAGILGEAECQVSINERLWLQVPGDLARQIALTELGALRSAGYPSGVRIFSENHHIGDGSISEAVAQGGIDLSVFGQQLKTVAPFGGKIDLSGMRTRFTGSWKAGNLSDADMNEWAIKGTMDEISRILRDAIQRALPGVLSNVLDESFGAPYYFIG